MIGIIMSMKVTDNPYFHKKAASVSLPPRPGKL
nr:MAG TPA_asm: hypothetical protein [Caudoviricetes sp.]